MLQPYFAGVHNEVLPYFWGFWGESNRTGFRRSRYGWDMAGDKMMNCCGILWLIKISKFPDISSPDIWYIYIIYVLYIYIYLLYIYMYGPNESEQAIFTGMNWGKIDSKTMVFIHKLSTCRIFLYRFPVSRALFHWNHLLVPTRKTPRRLGWVHRKPSGNRTWQWHIYIFAKFTIYHYIYIYI
jgi:hypothetical protein